MEEQDHLWKDRQVIHRVTTIDNEWERLVERVTTNENEWYNEWQRMATSGFLNKRGAYHQAPWRELFKPGGGPWRGTVEVSPEKNP